MSRGTQTIFGMAGVVLPFAGATAPNGWLLCEGQAVSRTAYAHLFAVIGTTYGAGDGSTTFNVPDTRGEFIRGVDAGAGRDPSRVLGSKHVATGIPIYAGGGGGGAVTCGPVNGDPVVYTNAGYSREQSSSTIGVGCDYPGVRPRNIALNHIIKT